jgi:hypothetical protein
MCVPSSPSSSSSSQCVDLLLLRVLGWFVVAVYSWTDLILLFSFFSTFFLPQLQQRQPSRNYTTWTIEKEKDTKV